MDAPAVGRPDRSDNLVHDAVRVLMRVSEGLGLQWSDVDLDRGTLQVRRAVQRFGGSASARRPLLAERKRLLRALGEAQAADDRETAMSLQIELKRVREALKPIKTAVQVVEPKSTRSRRTIALPAIVVKALNRCRVRQLEARMAAGKRWQDSGFVSPRRPVPCSIREI